MSVKQRVEAMIEALRDDDPGALAKGRDLLDQLRESREFAHMVELAEALSRVEPEIAKTRRQYAQALIETGKVTAAIDMLRAMLGPLPATDSEVIEATGLLGRAYKQVYFDARARGTPGARQALQRSIEYYRVAYDVDHGRYWHGVNLLALIEYCRRNGVAYPDPIDAAELSARLRQTVAARARAGEVWCLATLAEATLPTRDWGAIESALQNYASAAEIHAFALGSTLRQLTDVWELGKSERGKAMLEILGARMMMLPKASIEIPASQLLQKLPDLAHFQAMLGPQKGTRTFKWWGTGMKRATSVAAIRVREGGRVGSGFLVKAADFFEGAGDETLVLTNFHVVNAEGEDKGIRPEDAEVVFEGSDPVVRCEVENIVWSSPPDECDASLLRLKPRVTNIEPLRLGRALPVLEQNPPQPPVYVIGHPGGQELTYSFIDNEIIDHEGPTAGKPCIPGVSRLHYRAETEGGSSGSPVFNSSWDVIALHHKGGKIGMPRLNGLTGTYGANEGIWIQSIIGKIKAGAASLPPRATGTGQP